MANLTSFQADFHETGPKGSNTFIFNLANTTDFTFDPNFGLDFAAGSAASNIQLCSGGPDTNAVCFNIPPNIGAAVTPFSGFFDDLPLFGETTTRQGSSVTPATSPVPEPGSTSLLTVAGAALLAFGSLRSSRKRLKARVDGTFLP